MNSKKSSRGSVQGLDELLFSKGTRFQLLSSPLPQVASKMLTLVIIWPRLQAGVQRNVGFNSLEFVHRKRTVHSRRWMLNKADSRRWLFGRRIPNRPRLQAEVQRKISQLLSGGKKLAKAISLPQAKYEAGFTPAGETDKRCKGARSRKSR
eukprot:GHVU01190327.1.p1 GENE.GHVU01190327.1~~GHVU01190327.1.p1  ORF type:complete len:151 (-),score=3.84 GHVU01190327.1:334-786(-)